MRRELKGAYVADRAAALSGVPKSTIHYWSRNDILVPSISAERVKLWSYGDLMGLRTIYWLRQEKVARSGHDVPRTSMNAVRRALRALRELDLELWTEEHGPTVAVDREGEVFVTGNGAVSTVGGQRVIEAELLNLIPPFETELGYGPDLYAPRPSLRIIPGKLAGSPHIVKTRIETIALAALEDRGLEEEKIAALYPIAPRAAISDALELERQLQRNLAAAA